jgi:mannose-6-phosphate isomerase-like protein (cupin superfamily)
MPGYNQNIEQLTLENENFRQVLYTAKNSQLVLMSLQPGEEIGEEVHTVDQFFRIEKGEGFAVINGDKSGITDGSAVIVPAGCTHNIVNTSSDAALKLYTIYSPPNHRDGVVHVTKDDAEADEGKEHFDGTTTENI